MAALALHARGDGDSGDIIVVDFGHRARSRWRWGECAGVYGEKKPGSKGARATRDQLGVFKAVAEWQNEVCSHGWLLGPVCQSSHIDCTSHDRNRNRIETTISSLCSACSACLRSAYASSRPLPRSIASFYSIYASPPCARIFPIFCSQSTARASCGKLRQVGPVSARSGSPRHQKVCAKLRIKLYLYYLGGLPIACQSHPLRRFIDPSSFHNFIRRRSEKVPISPTYRGCISPRSQITIIALASEGYHETDRAPSTGVLVSVALICTKRP